MLAATNESLVWEAGAAYEPAFVRWWHEIAPPQYFDDDAMRELAAVAFRAGQDNLRPAMERMREGIRLAVSCLDELDQL